MTTAQQVLDVERSQLGQGESPPGSNRTKYGAWYGFDGVAWCSMFQCWSFFAAGAGALVAGAKTAKGSAYSGDVLAHFAAEGRVNMIPAPGALVIWDWPNAGTANDHIGMVELVNGNGTVGTIEGNDPARGGGPDVVARHTRDARWAVRGYCHPAYTDVAPGPVPQPAPTSQENDMKGRIIQCRIDGPTGNPTLNAQGWFFATCDPKPVKWHVPTIRIADFMLMFGHASNSRPDQVDQDIFDSYATV